jgi:activator of HSP90 ATPase
MKTLHKYFSLDASVADVYNALTNKTMLEIWTGEPVEFEMVPDSEFSLWDGAIMGRNLAFEINRSIKQIWYFDEIESEVELLLHSGKKSTSVELKQNNIPDEAFDNIVEGWSHDFFGALAELFNN